MGTLRGARVLLIDDSPDICMLFRIMLTREGVLFESTDDAMRGLERLRIEAFDLVLMDLEMPHLDGFAAIAQARHADYHGTILALSAHTSLLMQERVLAAGFDGHLVKSGDWPVIISALAAWTAKLGAHEQPVRNMTT